MSRNRTQQRLVEYLQPTSSAVRSALYHSPPSPLNGICTVAPQQEQGPNVVRSALAPLARVYDHVAIFRMSHRCFAAIASPRALRYNTRREAGWARRRRRRVARGRGRRALVVHRGAMAAWHMSLVGLIERWSLFLGFSVIGMWDIVGLLGSDAMGWRVRMGTGDACMGDDRACGQSSMQCDAMPCHAIRSHYIPQHSHPYHHQPLNTHRPSAFASSSLPLPHLRHPTVPITTTTTVAASHSPAALVAWPTTRPPGQHHLVWASALYHGLPTAIDARCWRVARAGKRDGGAGLGGACEARVVVIVEEA
ncbi:hypothetical protein SVAN01_08060 [Stagonosporopsis vannaccii]|nr:hypothetical protein SVAN01_08060 [Stagonosporopsis vannaccii]